ncbi:MAG TPA: translocation/assembly module TamB domain-containing protein [Rhizomicrobium sp.]
MTGLRWFLTALVGIALVLLALLNTGPGHSTLEALVTPLSGQTVNVKGLRGELPDKLQADLVEISDTKGVWLRIEGLSLDWSALSAINNHIAVHDVRAAKVALLRMPISEESSEGTAPIIDIGRLAVARIEIAKPAIGHAALLTANGSLHYESIHQLSADLTMTRLDGPDRYRVNGHIEQDVANGAVSIHENTGGILAALAGLPGLGPINVEAVAGGDRAQNTLTLDLSAGALRASGRGTIALASRTAAIDFFAHAPAMQPRADIAWQSLLLNGHIHGSFDEPNIDAKLRLENVRAAGASSAQISADVTGNSGVADLTATATALRLPGSSPDLLASVPVVLKAHADLNAPARPIAFALMHPVLNITGNARTAGSQSLAAAVIIPSLAPFSQLAGTELGGAARINVHAQQNAGLTAVTLDGNLHMAGAGLVARLLGGNATLALRANIAGSDISYSTLALRGAGFTSDIKGTLRSDTLNYTIVLGLPDIARLAPTLNGDLSLNATLTGPTTSATIKANGSANIASNGFARQRIGFSLGIDGLPNPSTAQIRAGGALDGAPLSLDGALATTGKIRNAKLAADWKSLHAHADLKLPPNGDVTGRVDIALKRLSDLTNFIGTRLEGSLTATVDADTRGGKSLAAIHMKAAGLRSGDMKADALTMEGTVANPFGRPSFDLKLDARKIAASGATGSGTATLKGPLDRLAVALKSDMRDSAGNPAHAVATAVVDTGKNKLSLQSFSGRWQDEELTLKAPATVDFAKGLAVDKLAAKLAGGDLAISGRFTPKLDASVVLNDVPMKALTRFVPQLAPEGTLSANAQLTGTLDAPQGKIALQGRGLRAVGMSRATGSADLDAHATLHGKSATVNATLAAGNAAHLTLAGEAPLDTAKPMALRVAGNADLALLNPILTASGRQAKGTLTLDMHLTGTYAAPRATGGGNLANGELQDFTQGIRVRAITAAFQAQGDMIRITQLSARAGSGSITGSGSIDLASPGMPVDISIEAKNARPVASDMLTATLSGNAKLTGKLKGDLNLSGRIRVLEGEINLPDKFPPQVAVLDVRRRGQAPPPPPQPASRIALDMTVSAPEQIFVRGHGIDAEVSGRIHLTGTTATPFASGHFDMRRGTFSIAGQTLNFTSGKIGFNGTGVRNKLDPTLDFVASTTSGGVTATLTVGGYASAPTIALSSSPQLPQDEVLAHLLFQQSVKQLSPLQLAEIAQALASLGGIGNGFSPMSAIRKGLGLDRLSVGGASGNSGETSVEAGKYVARNVYVGARQNLSGGTQVQVQVDITRRLKAQATLSTVTNATVTKGNAAQDNGSSVGLSYQFEY